MTTEGGRALRIQLLIGFMCVALVVYLLLLGRIAWAFVTSGSAAAVGLGLAILVMPLIGVWVKLLRVPYDILFPAIIIFCCIGAYTVDNNSFDIYVAAFFGLFVSLTRTVAEAPDCARTR